MRPIRAAVLLCLVILSGCATTTPTTEDGRSALAEPVGSAFHADMAQRLGVAEIPAGAALIYLYRPERYVGSANTYQISVNGSPVADMRIGTRFPYSVPAGRVVLEGRSLANILNIGLALGLMEHPSVAFDVEGGKLYFIDVQTGFAGGPQFEFVDLGTGLEAIQGLKVAPRSKPE